MTGTNGNNHTNGNGRTKLQNTTAEISGFGIAEVVGGITTLGAMYALQVLPKAIMDPATDIVAKVVEPIQERVIEPGIGIVCKLDECKPDKSKPVSERAKASARLLLLAIPSVIAAWYAKLGIRRWYNNINRIADSHATGSILQFWKWSPEEKMLVLADEGVHVASMAVANSAPAAPFTDKAIGNMKDVLKNMFGMSDDDAHEMSTMIAIHEVPNLIGAAASAGVIAGRHHRDWPTGWVGKVLGRKPVVATNFVEKISSEAVNNGANHLLAG